MKGAALLNCIRGYYRLWIVWAARNEDRIFEAAEKSLEKCRWRNCQTGNERWM